MSQNTAKNVLITGASRGIGLGLAQRFLVHGHRVFATMRHPDGAREAWELEAAFPGRVTLLALDVTDRATIDAAARQLLDVPLDILVNNAGVLPGGDEAFEDLSEAHLLKAFEVNALGPVRVARAFLPNLRRAKGIIANISSKVGSIGDNQSGGMYAYRTSKTALNMLTKCMAIELEDLTCVALHPGWVKTEMGGSEAPTEVVDSARGLYEVIMGLTPKDSGRFLDFRGKEIPW